MRTATVAAVVFAATFVAIGIVGLIVGDFVPIWDPVPKGLPARTALAYLIAVISLTAGLGLLWRRTASIGSRVLCASVLVWFVLFRIPVILRAPSVEVVWEGCGETAVILAAAWIVYAEFASDRDRRWLGFAVGERGERFARALYGLALLPIGLSHLVYLKQTAALVPAWLPAHATWAYLTGCAYLAAGVAVLIGILAPLAAALSALQMGLFTLLVWVPVLVRGHPDASQWSEGLDSWALTVAAWVVAASYHSYPAVRSVHEPVLSRQELVSRSEYDPIDRR